MHNLTDTLIDHYHLGDRIAKGGMSEIYLAEDIDTQQTVAIKLVHSSNIEHYARFQYEIQTLAALDHPHIIPALAYGTYEAWRYLVTPYFANGTLDTQLAQGPLTLDETSELLTQLGSALQLAHNHGILHRDIKPSNVLMRDSTYAYLADFGLARHMHSASSITASNYLIGTAEYMAPELAEEKASVSSDIYALGVLLYQLLTGRVPFKGQTPISTFLKHMSEAPTPPSSFNPAIPPAIERVILKALEKRPENRFKTVQELVAAYQAALHLAEAPSETLTDAFEPVEVHLLDISASITAPHQVRTRARQPLISMLVATLALFISLFVGLTFYGPTLGDNGNASNLSRVDIATTPVVKTHNIPGPKGETSGDIQKQQKSAPPAHPIQLFDNKQPDNNSDLEYTDEGTQYQHGHHDVPKHKQHIHQNHMRPSL